jgi:phage tail sheath protein FI
MPEYLAPGVYVEEIERGPKPIEGVATSTAAFLGQTERGPTRPYLITTYGEYVRLFGEAFKDGAYLPHAVKAFFDNGGKRAYIARIVGPMPVNVDGVAKLTIGDVDIRALGAGEAYERVWARIEAGTTKDKNGDPIGFRLRLAYWTLPLPPSTNLFDPFDPNNNALLPRPSLFEDFDDVSLDPASPSYWDKRINNGNSAFVTIAVKPTATLAALTPAQGGVLTNGDDGGTPTDAQFKGDDSLPSDQRTGLAALDLDTYRDVAIVAAPGRTDVQTLKELVTHCENNRFRIAVLDAEENQAVADNLKPRDDIDDTKYAAFYYPWYFMSEPRTARRVAVPPSGAVCGIYALTDNTRGVWKSPANETINGALDLKYEVTHGVQETLNPKGVNVIRRFPGRGIRVWGARTMSSDPLWKYVSVRRLFIFIESSIYRNTQWVVFEPNDERLWARVKQTLTLFLRTQWREGALMGTKEEEAFSIAIGRDTMTEDDILNGRLIIEVGIAPVRPAEFVIFRVFQKTMEAKA